MRRSSWVLAIGAAIGIGLLVGAPAAVGAPQPPGSGPRPTATSDHPSATLGSMVRVQGAGWGGAGTGVVKVQVCGNGGVSRSADCDLAGTASGAIRAGGTFFTAITVHRPPKPCPCVLRVTSSVTPYEVRIPIDVPGMPTAPVVAISPTNRALKVSKVSITNGDSFGAWFGARPHRTLQFTLANTGNVALSDPAIDLAFGKGDDPAGFMESPRVSRLAPGEKRVVRVAVPLPAGSFGTQRVTVSADPIGGVTSKGSAETTTYPWGLFVLALLLLQLVLLAIRNRVRRATTAEAAKQVSAAPAADPTTDPLAVDAAPELDPIRS